MKKDKSEEREAPAATRDDPAFTAIVAHRATCIAAKTIFDEHTPTKEWEQRMDTAYDHTRKKLARLMRTTLTTLLGMAAYFEYLASMNAGNQGGILTTNIERAVEHWRETTESRMTALVGHLRPARIPTKNLQLGSGRLRWHFGVLPMLPPRRPTWPARSERRRTGVPTDALPGRP
jgi:hypothetical protein